MSKTIPKRLTLTPQSIVVMGVSGCGKSTVAAALAQHCGWTLIEGDDFHSAASVAKMQQGIALTDDDRAAWLLRLGEQLRAHEGAVVLTCSALKLRYRNTLRQAVPNLKFIYLQLGVAAAKERVARRAPEHYFPASLVDSQFAALEEPTHEPLVLQLQAGDALALLQTQVQHWLTAQA